MQPIAAWLEKLGMSEYVQRFAENDLDISVLPHLTDQDFKELGVSLGHRRKLGELKWWSQRSDEGGCDETCKAAFGSVWPGAIGPPTDINGPRRK